MKNIQIESLRDSYDPFVLRLIEKFKDPSGKNRKPYCLLIDSTKIPIMKSGDQEVQKRTFYGKKDGHFVTFTVSEYFFCTHCDFSYQEFYLKILLLFSAKPQNLLC